MSHHPHPASALHNALRLSALRYPEAEEGIACAGTAIEKRTVKARNKAFLFLGVSDAMLKLGESLAEAKRLAAKEPGRYSVGSGGWVKVTFGDDAALPLDVLERWIGESYRLLVPEPKKKAAKKRTANKSARRKGRSG